MGFSTTAGFIILISTMLVCSIYLYSSIDFNIAKVNNAYYNYMNYMHNKDTEKLEIVSAYNISNVIYITLSNKGPQTLDSSKWTVLYNGVPINFSIDSNSSYLTPLNNITISINATVPARICIVSEYGNKYYCSVS